MTPSPEASLPSDILANIFCLHASLCSFIEPLSLRPKTPEELLSWVWVSHVNRRWREVALGCPILWRNIPTCCPAWARVMLERSQPAPIIVVADTFHFSSSPGLLETALYALEHNSARIEKLEATVPIDFFAHIIKFLTSPTPQLISLTIRVSSHAFSRTAVLSFAQLSTAPRLCELSLSRIPLVWGPLAPSLTSLSITPIDSSNRVSASELLDVLNGLPLLVHVHLVDVVNHSVQKSAPIVNLPRLQSIRIIGQAILCSVFLKHVRFPARALLGISVLKQRGEVNFWPTFMSIISRHLEESASLFRQVTVKTSMLWDGAQLTLEAASSLLQFPSDEFRMLSLSVTDPEASLAQLIVPIMQRIPHLELLRVSTVPSPQTSFLRQSAEYGMDADAWRDALQFTDVQTVHFERYPSRGLLQALSWEKSFSTVDDPESTETAEKQGKVPLTLPSLRKLVFERVVFYKLACVIPDGDVDLPSALRARRDRWGLSFEEVIFRDCPGVSDEDENVMKQFVLSVAQ